MRILFFGDGQWGTKSLNRLIKEKKNIIGVVTRTKATDSLLLETAHNFGITVYCPKNVNSDKFIKTVTDLKPDLNLSVSYDQILKEKIRQTAPLGFINFHAGKLPYYRGRNPINWAIINGEKEIGITAHYVDEGIDTGNIILQKCLPILWEDTYADVLSRVIDSIPSLVSEAVSLIDSGMVKPVSQSQNPGTYFAAREQGDEWIDWNDTSLKIYNKIRAISDPAPGAITIWGDHVVKIWQAFYQPDWTIYDATPGQVVGRIPNCGVIVKTGDSVIEIRKVEIEQGIRFVPQWKIGTRLGLNHNLLIMNLLERIITLEKKLEKTLKQVDING